MLESLTTEQLHNTVKTIATCNNMILKGMFPGIAHVDIKESLDWLELEYNKYYDAFRARPDAESYHPGISKVGTVEVVQG